MWKKGTIGCAVYTVDTIWKIGPFINNDKRTFLKMTWKRVPECWILKWKLWKESSRTKNKNKNETLIRLNCLKPLFQNRNSHPLCISICNTFDLYKVAIKFTWMREKDRKPISWQKCTSQINLNNCAVVTQIVFIYAYWKKMKTYWKWMLTSLHNAKAYFQFNICIVQHIIYIFALMLCYGHKVLWNVRAIQSRKWFWKGFVCRQSVQKKG